MKSYFSFDSDENQERSNSSHQNATKKVIEKKMKEEQRANEIVRRGLLPEEVTNSYQGRKRMKRGKQMERLNLKLEGEELESSIQSLSFCSSSEQGESEWGNLI